MSQSNDDARGAWYQLVLERLKDSRVELSKLETRQREDIKELRAKIDNLEDSIARIKAQAAILGGTLAFVASEAIKWLRAQ